MHISLQETPALKLHPDDDVAVALMPLPVGRPIAVGGHSVRLAANIAAGHKIALRALEPGMPVRRYGQVIGFATAPIAPGDHVHSHNLAVGAMTLEYEFGTDLRPVPLVPPPERRTFMGYRRASGRAGTRNTLAVIGTVNCAAHTVRRIAERARAELLPKYPNVTDIVAIAHKSGCATRADSPELELLQRTLAGFARHPNVAAFLFVGLGCEVNQWESLFATQRARLEGQNEVPGLRPEQGATQYAARSTQSLRLPPYIGIQDEGGVARTIEAGLRALEQLLPIADQYRREPVPVSELCLALQCGGSDGFSGITANPALGHAVDLLVAQGGTAVLSETPEVYGAEHLLTRRAVSRAVGEKLIHQIRWWEEYTAREGFEIDNNPAPGNKAGGLTTIFEKSLGAVAKGGSMPLTAVYDYAEPITASGFTFMDTPGYDPVSATGQVAGGCTIIAFTTGRGSCFGFKPAPSIKIATNSVTYERMRSDMDINAGRILEGASIEEVGREIFERLIAVASGEPSLSEAQGIGEEEFNPWILGATM
ncbi:MAG TPA: altronate dehydratase family protein [Roseiflexaceae bacterium]|nr:altronate dehydratase family protein [Roseiflexaceae bacterium]